MDIEKTVRKPIQKRSIQMKEKILDAAMQLICEKGFFEMTTNEIAKTAGISIGSLYSYFSDKDTILTELLERHHQHFLTVFEDLKTEINLQLYKEDKREWLRCLVQNLIDLHLSVKDFNKELKILYFAKSEVAFVLDNHMEKIQRAVLDLMRQDIDNAKFDDLDTACVVIVEFINALVDRIVFKDNPADNERILNMGIDMLYMGCIQPLYNC